MQTIFSVPMRNNNNNLQETGDQRLGDWVDFGTFHKLTSLFVVESLGVGDEIDITYSLTEGTRTLFESTARIQEIGNFVFSLMHGETTENTLLNAAVQTIGQARFSIDVSAADRGEDYVV